MSLLEGMLLEPVPIQAPTERIERIIHIALRTDGQMGSGTEADPFHGGTVRTAPLAIVIMDREVSTGPSDPYAARVDEVTATTATPHGYQAGELVEISGVTGSTPQFFNGVFAIKSVGTTTFVFEVITPRHNDTSFQPGTPVLTGATCRKVTYLIDKWLGELPASSVAWIGPGTFETRGSFARITKSGQKIHGTGMFLTTLKMTPDQKHRPPEDNHGWALASDAFVGGYVDYFEAADFTVDCNLRAFPPGWPDEAGALRRNPYSRLALGGVVAQGSHNRLRRIRVVDFGSQEPKRECFPLVTGPYGSYPEVSNGVIEDCVMEEPAKNFFRETTCLKSHGERGAQMRGFGLRHNFLDGRHSDGTPGLHVQILSVSRVSYRRYRVTTVVPHHRLVGNSANIAGIKYYDPLSGSYLSSKSLNGAFVIVLVPEASTFEYQVPLEPEELSPAEPAFSSGLYLAQDAALVETIFGPTAEGGTGSVVEGNRVYHLTGGNNHDTWSSRDSTYRGNYYANVFTGPGQALHDNTGFPTVSAPSAPSNIQSLTCGGPGNRTATLVVEGASHFLRPGDAVHVRGVRVGGNLNNPFNGVFEVASVTGLASLTYVMSVAPAANPDPLAATSPVPEWAEPYRTRNLVVERNVIQLARSTQGHDRCSAIPISGGYLLGDYFATIRRVIVRENLIHNHPEAVPETFYGVSFVGCEYALAQHNVIGLAGPAGDILADVYAGQKGPDGVVRGGVAYLNNLKNATTPLAGWHGEAKRGRDELRTKIQDAFLMSL